MNFEFTEEQEMLRESLARFLRDKYDFDTRREIIASNEGWSREIWSGLAEMGVMGAAFPEDYDGFGGTHADLLIVMEELGRALVVEPYLPTVVLAGQLLRAAGGAQALALIPKISMGELIMAFGYAEPRSRFSLSHVETRAQESGDGYTISGRKAVVLGAPAADKLIVSARTSGAVADEDGISLFIIDRGQDGVRIEGYPTIDGLRAGEVHLENAAVARENLIGTAGGAFPLIERIIDRAIVAASAEAIGLCRRMNELTTDYCRQREQFGQPIGKFQVLQHKMVDMFIHAEEMVSMAYMAAMNADTEGHDLRIAASMAKVQLGKSLKFVGENAIQLHGGMGITEEMAVGHYFMHGTMLELLFGNTDYHRKRYQALAA